MHDPDNGQGLFLMRSGSNRGVPKTRDPVLALLVAHSLVF